MHSITQELSDLQFCAHFLFLRDLDIHTPLEPTGFSLRNFCCTRSEVLRAVLKRIRVLWDVTPSGCVILSWHFKGSCHLQLHWYSVHEELDWSPLKMRAIRSSKTHGTTYQATQLKSQETGSVIKFLPLLYRSILSLNLAMYYVLRCSHDQHKSTRMKYSMTTLSKRVVCIKDRP